MKAKGGADSIDIEVLNIIHGLLKEFVHYMITQAVKLRLSGEDIGVSEGGQVRSLLSILAKADEFLNF